MGLSSVEFRLGDVERLPVSDASVDVIMSNCVINLAPDKPVVFREAFRVLAPGGRLAISDMVAVGDLPAALERDPAAYTACVAGAAPVADLVRMIEDAGFEEVRVTVQRGSGALADDWSPGTGAGQVVASALIEAVKPSPCCESALLSACCPPEAKSECCGPSPRATTCGCQPGPAGKR